MFIFSTKLESLSFFWLNDNQKITDEIKSIEFKYCGAFCDANITYAKEPLETIGMVSYFSYDNSTRLTNVNVILEYNESNKGKNYDNPNYEDSMIYTQNPIYPINASKALEFLDKLDTSKDTAITLEPGLVKFMAELNGTAVDPKIKLFQPTFRKQKLYIDNNSNTDEITKYDSFEINALGGAFTERGFNLSGEDNGFEKIVINTMRIQVSQYGIGKVHIDAQLIKGGRLVKLVI